MAEQNKSKSVFFPRAANTELDADVASGATDFPAPLDGARGFRGFSGVDASGAVASGADITGAKNAGANVADPVAPDRAIPLAPANEPNYGDRFARPDGQKIVFPRRRLGGSWFFRGWFIASFITPVLLAALYLFLIAPDEYTTEFRFSVRQPESQQSGVNTSSFGTNAAATGNMRDNYTVADFVSSSQAAAEVAAKADLKTMFNRPGDPFSRLGDAPSRERVAKFWQKMVDSDYDPTSGLAVVRVRAYTAADSYAIAGLLLAQSSDLINGIGQQSQQDSLRFARAEVDRASADVATLRNQLQGLRNRSGTVDPVTNQLNGDVQIANQLKLQLAQTEGQISALLEQLRNPNAPQIRLLQQQVAGMRGALQRTQSAIGGSNGAGRSDLVTAVGQFEDVNARMASAVEILEANANKLNTVQAEANAQRLYLATYVKPTMPEAPTRPQRLLDLLIVALIAGTLFLIGVLLGKSVMDHAR